jgi:hypothetical protein
VARIRSLSHASDDGRIHPTEVDCTWQIVTDQEKKYLQLSTYGSDSRASHPKVSQTIQLDASMARSLADIIRQTFGSD